MMLIGVDYHPSFQTIAFFVEETGEYVRLRHRSHLRRCEQFDSEDAPNSLVAIRRPHLRWVRLER